MTLIQIISCVNCFAKYYNQTSNHLKLKTLYV